MRIPIHHVPAAIAVAIAALAAPALALAQGPCASRLPTEPITLNLRDANVQTTLRLLAQQYRVNMIVTDEVKGTVTVDFFQVQLLAVKQPGQHAPARCAQIDRQINLRCHRDDF